MSPSARMILRILALLMLGVAGGCGYAVSGVQKGMPIYGDYIFENILADRLFATASDLLTLSMIMIGSLVVCAGILFVMASKARTYYNPSGSGVMEMIVEEPPPPPLPPPFPKEKYGE